MGLQDIQYEKSKESDQSSVHLASTRTTSSPLWWDTSNTQNTHSFLPKSLNNMNETQYRHSHGKQLGHWLQDQESSSTQSSCQSFNEVADGGEAGTHDQFNLVQYGSSGHREAYGRQNDRKVTCSSPGIPSFIETSQDDNSPAAAHNSYPYAEPYYGGMLTAYGPQAVIHPPLLAMAPGRVPLPLDFPDGLVYVNAKQYHAILRRRKARAKLGIQNKLEKARKMYLHESRHQHAMKRVRGPGGRFLNTKLLESNPSTSDDRNDSDPSPHQLLENHAKPCIHQSETSNVGASAACSEITSISNNDDVLEQNDLGFTSAFRSHVGGVMQVGGGGKIQNTSHCGV